MKSVTTSSFYPAFGKRVFDALVSFPALLMLLPFLCVVAILVRLKLGSPIFYKHERPGKDGAPFVLYKFRTMRNNVDENGVLLPDEKRLTRTGKFLRSSSIDELPELWNVSKGDMSLVGPRPLLVEYLDRYTPEQARRHEVKPGITGWAQVNGRNALSWEEKFKLDVWYVDNHSFFLDMKILWLTLTGLFQRKGISHSGHATMPLFRGSNEET